MRLPEPSSSQRASYTVPVRGHESLSYVQPPGGQRTSPFDPSAGLGFFRPSLDFTSIFNASSGVEPSTPSANQTASDPPSPAESTEKVQQAETDDDAIEPLDEEEDEAVEENDSIALQPVALIADTPVEVPKVQSAETGELASDPISDAAEQSTSRPVVETKSVDAVNTELSAKTTASAEPTIAKTPSATTTDRPESPSDNAAPTPIGQTRAASPDASTPVDQTLSPQVVVADETSPVRLQVSTEGAPKTETPNVATDQTVAGDLAGRAPQQASQSDSGQTPVTSEGDDSVKRTSRHARGRNSGNTNQNRGTNGPESSSQNREKTDAAAGNIPENPSLVDAANDTSTVSAPSTATSAPTTVPAPSAEAAVVAGQAVGTATQESGNRAAPAASATSDLTTIGPSSSDDSGRNGDHTPGRASENLSRTDIADRARLIHRISKAFTKMGADGGQIRMKMHPETLGGVLLEMRVRGRNVEATVTADNEAARGVLQQQLSELRQRLESQGMTVQRLEVALRDESANNGSLMNDHRGELFGGDRGSDGNSQPRHPNGRENTGKTRLSPPIEGANLPRPFGLKPQSLRPAAPGTLDLRL